MASLILIAAVICCLLACGELLVRRQLHAEFPRKFVHLTVGTLVAFWPLWLTKAQIVGFSAAFLVAILVSQTFHIFRAIHSVQRPTLGEACFAVAAGVIILVARNDAIYTAALLTMSVADGLAAIVGVRFGATSRYQVFRHTKSVAGTLAFVAATVLVFLGYCWHTGHVFDARFIVVALGAAVIENAGVYGLDNLLVPLMVALSLNALR